MQDWGAVAAKRLEIIAKASEPGPGVTRLPFGPEHEAALEIMTEWMTAAGCNVTLDAAGTLIGRREGPAGAPTLLIGSHQDSVRLGGAFDGIMGVALGCLALEALGDQTLPCSVEVLAFADEEGVRFPTALIGPRALAGTLDPGVFAMQDKAGVSLGAALTSFGGDPEGTAALARDPAQIAGYLELHIEQGPVLEAADKPLGVVTAISGIERHRVTIIGEAGHAGTVPMEMRHDALLAASDLVRGVHDMARAHGIRATVGQLDVSPNVVNAIPARVDLTIEIRAAEDPARAAMGAALGPLCARIATATATQVEIEKTYAQPAQACDAALREGLTAAIRKATGEAAPELPSGATHDASAMADLCPIAMLFVRCKGGISHNPAEYASAGDMGQAVSALAAFLSDYVPKA
ncbi:allantoate amidohydrolase [Thioclava dalianensis]|uniref:Allantoate amidohydrolase n=1 Tax=Thioclava dalianensis TaxID=1185766 RepID=A0A074TRW9_9RHOB|nr:M20 family metallo-hydrolase [Thioclava dalianensis]KEP71688.1 allantoate amidohydrolase [Thioclava dalianensis]SFN41047.1 allantoate deiminase [Thioclava dalianensis]